MTVVHVWLSPPTGILAEPPSQRRTGRRLGDVLTLVITRHGLTARSIPEQHLGQKIDIGLTNKGRAQAKALAQRLTAVSFDRILSSPLVRARQTAAILAAAGSAERPAVEIDPRLTEMDYGAWEGLTYAEIEARDPELRGRWESDPAKQACPDGESGDDVADRVEGFLRDLIGWHDRVERSAAEAERPILAVAHSTLNRVLLCVATGVPVRDFRRRFSQDQANLTVLRYEPGSEPNDARIVVLNDIAHLRGPGDVPWA